MTLPEPTAATRMHRQRTALPVESLPEPGRPDVDRGLGVPQLTGHALQAVEHRGTHIQIIAAAGSGKTEVVSQRVAQLLASGEPADSIVAFTFTEKAAAELKERIRERVTHRLGAAATDTLGQLRVGTIHAFCFRLLQEHVPQVETYTLLDEHQLTYWLYRVNRELNLNQFSSDGKALFRGLRAFQRSVDVVENELILDEQLPPGPFREALVRYRELLHQYRVLTFGQQIAAAVKVLADPTVHAAATTGLRHLIVDEYQDVNPAQEKLIQLLARPNGPAELVVVGDDDQAIYQWRGSNVRNIVTFRERYPDVATFELLTNRRSVPEIVELANSFASSIPNRLAKQMLPARAGAGPAVRISIGDAETTMDEAADIADQIVQLHTQGVAYADIAILVRARSAYPDLKDALAARRIPVQPGGRTGLFVQAEADLFGATMAWLVGFEWQSDSGPVRTSADLRRRYRELFALNAVRAEQLEEVLVAWQRRASDPTRDINLLREFYVVLELLELDAWDTSDDLTRNRIGTIARFTQLIADYETAARRSRRDPAEPGAQVGAQHRTPWYYKNFAILLKNYATKNYDDFSGEEGAIADAVALGTVHGAKGLEWPIVFVPSLTARRFPSSRTGKQQDWLVPKELFDSARYEGRDEDERRLFYVAITRAREWISLSAPARVKTQRQAASPYLHECSVSVFGDVPIPATVPARASSLPDLALSYSELAAYLDCPQSFLLRHRLGFMPPVADEIGYGHAVHHIMRLVAEHTQRAGRMPAEWQVDAMLARDFFLPFANKPAHRQMRARAKKLVHRYLIQHRDDLQRTWATERPFELYLPGIVVSGRADVVFDQHDGVPGNLAIVDYKTSAGTANPLQLQVYASAGRREGLAVTGAFVHDLSANDSVGRESVPIEPEDVAEAETTLLDAAARLRDRDLAPDPEAAKCRRCDVRFMCAVGRRVA